MSLLSNNISSVICLSLLILVIKPCYAEIDFDNLDKTYRQLEDKSSAHSRASSEVVNKANRVQSAFRDQDRKERAAEAARASQYQQTPVSSGSNDSEPSNQEIGVQKLEASGSDQWLVTCTNGKRDTVVYGKWGYLVPEWMSGRDYHKTVNEAAIAFCKYHAD